jgi:hypothetical protein
MTTTSTFRIPKATITGLYGRILSAYARRTWGEVPDNACVLWRNQKVMKENERARFNSAAGLRSASTVRSGS